MTGIAIAAAITYFLFGAVFVIHCIALVIHGRRERKDK